MDDNDLALLEKLGPEGVLLEMAKGEGRLGRPGSVVREEIEHWLLLEETKRSSASAAVRDAREIETLRIASEANSIARTASLSATAAAAAASEANTIARSNRDSATTSSRMAIASVIIAIIIAIVALKIGK